MAPLARGLLVAAALAVALGVPALAARSGSPRVLVAEFDNDVNPVTQDYLTDAIERGERGRLRRRRDRDGHAGRARLVDAGDREGDPRRRGAGDRLRRAERLERRLGRRRDRQAADVLAMAPQTNIGSSTPISIGGEDISKDLRRKVVNDAAAYIGELAREHGRNVAAAERDGHEGGELRRARGAASGTSSTSSRRLRRAARRRSTATTVAAEGPRRSTRAGHAGRADRDVGFWKRALDLLIDPNIIALMLSLGLVGIVVELWNPGLIFPGTVGAISLIVGLYGLQVLPVSVAGPAADAARGGVLRRRGVRRRAHGALTLAGAVTFVIGALMLFDPAGDAYQVSLPVALAIAGTLALLLGLRADEGGAGAPHAGRGRRPPARRRAEAEVRGDGLVFVDGELWRARRADGTPLVPGRARRRRGGRAEGLAARRRINPARRAIPAERT